MKPSERVSSSETTYDRNLGRQKKGVDYIFYEVTRSVCFYCCRVISAQMLLHNNKVYIRKHCPEHGLFEHIVHGDAQNYVLTARMNSSQQFSLDHFETVLHSYSYECGSYPDYQSQIHIPMAGMIDCPISLTDGEHGGDLTLDDVLEILNYHRGIGEYPDIVQFSGREPAQHPHIIEMMRAARLYGIPYIIFHTHGKRIATDDDFLTSLCEVRPTIYLRFDGFERETNRLLCGEPDILEQRLLALDRLAMMKLNVVLVVVLDRSTNLHEIGRILRLAIDHPAIKGISFQPILLEGRYDPLDFQQYVTTSEILQVLEGQSSGRVKIADFKHSQEGAFCHPLGNVVTYALMHDRVVVPLSRLLCIGDYVYRNADKTLTFSSKLQEELARQGFSSSCKFLTIMIRDFMELWTSEDKNEMYHPQGMPLSDNQHLLIDACKHANDRIQTYI